MLLTFFKGEDISKFNPQRCSPLFQRGARGDLSISNNEMMLNSSASILEMLLCRLEDL